MTLTHFPILTAIALLPLALSAAPLQGNGIIPAPVKCEAGTGNMVLSGQTKIVWHGNGTEELARTLGSGLKERTGLSLSTLAWSETDNPTASIIIERTTAAGSPGPATAEAYSLVVSPSNITVRASSEAGLFYGVQSLLQLATSK
ncbi:MAG TPA: glycoside hydrolase family 20 zincin-like fold domain-containing protein, partial [Luteolibacter sp.]